MHDDDVSSFEMRWFRPIPDEIDAVLGDAVLDDDLTDVAALVHDLRGAYLPDEPLRRSAELLAFTEGSPARARLAPAATSGAERPAGSRRALTAVGAVAATLTGKLVLGTAVAAASVGGLHAAGVVDVPGLPEQADQADEGLTSSEAPPVETGGSPAPLPDDAPLDEDPPAIASGDGQPMHIMSFVGTVHEWVVCVSGIATQHTGDVPLDLSSCSGSHPSAHAPGAGSGEPGAPADAGSPDDAPGQDVRPDSPSPAPTDEPDAVSPAADAPPADSSEAPAGEPDETPAEPPAEAPADEDGPPAEPPAPDAGEAPEQPQR